MKITALTVDNFRQFYGSKRIEFARSEDRNVTVIYGANGAGKTTLLNAFTWGLYKEFTPAFENPDHIINERAWIEAKPGTEISGRVTIEFEHEDRNYTLQRVTTHKKGPGGSRTVLKDSAVELFYRDETGEQKSVKNPNDAVSQILPERLHTFFFFDGERIERLVRQDAYAEIQDGIKTVLGLEIIERSIKHTSQALTKLNADLREAGSPELQTILDELNELTASQTKKQADLKKQEANKESLQTEIEKVNSRLRTLEEAKGIQEKRDALEELHQKNQQQIVHIRTELAQICSHRGYLAFSSGLAKDALTLIDVRRQRGELPTPIKRQFVEDLLKKGRCICGEPLVKGDPHYDFVASWRDKAGLADVEEASISLSAHMEEFVRTREVMYKELHQKRGELASIRTDQTRIAEELSELGKRLVKTESEQVRNLELRRDTLKREIEDITRVIWGLNRDLEDAKSKIAEKEKERDAAKAEGERAKVAQKRVHIASEARDIFKQILQIRTDDVRKQLDDKLKAIYSRISYKPYTPCLTPDFHLELNKVLDARDEAVAKGQGENQILSLSFVGGLADLARQRYLDSKSGQSRKGVLSFQGGIYPIVMDSPFGSLDENYRTQVAAAIPLLAPQVIVFVSKSQGSGAVEKELNPRVGQRYVISYYTPKKDAKEEDIKVNGKTLPYIRQTKKMNFEWAEILEA